MAKLTVEIPDALLSKLELTGQPLQTVVLQTLEQYAETAIEFPIAPVDQSIQRLSGMLHHPGMPELTIEEIEANIQQTAAEEVLRSLET